MRKFLAAGILAVFSLFLLSKSHAVPLDVPYGTLYSSTTSGKVTLSSGTYPGTSGAIPYQNCLSHIVVSAPSAATFTMVISTNATMTPSTTFYSETSDGTAYDTQWAYKTPVCAPAGNFLQMIDSVATSTITYEGYTFIGWSAP